MAHPGSRRAGHRIGSGSQAKPQLSSAGCETGQPCTDPQGDVILSADPDQVAPGAQANAKGYSSPSTQQTRSRETVHDNDLQARNRHRGRLTIAPENRRIRYSRLTKLADRLHTAIAADRHFWVALRRVWAFCDRAESPH